MSAFRVSFMHYAANLARF